MKKTLLSLFIIFVLTFQLNAKTIKIDSETIEELIEISLQENKEDINLSSTNCTAIYLDVLNCEMKENKKTYAEAQKIAANAFYACRQQEALQQMQ